MLQTIGQKRGAYTRKRRKKFAYLKNTGQLSEYYRQREANKKEIPFEKVVNQKNNKLIKLTKMTKYAFLKSTRFWALIIIAIVGVLKADGIFPDLLADALITIAGGFTVIRTIDRNVGDAFKK